MNANNDDKRSDLSLYARLVSAAAKLRFAALVDFLVARWLERSATNAEAAQSWFKTDPKPARKFGMGKSVAAHAEFEISDRQHDMKSRWQRGRMYIAP
jgi:hypothetical protein